MYDMEKMKFCSVTAGKDNTRFKYLGAISSGSADNENTFECFHDLLLSPDMIARQCYRAE